MFLQSKISIVLNNGTRLSRPIEEIICSNFFPVFMTWMTSQKGLKKNCRSSANFIVAKSTKNGRHAADLKRNFKTNMLTGCPSRWRFRVSKQKKPKMFRSQLEEDLKSRSVNVRIKLKSDALKNFLTTMHLKSWHLQQICQHVQAKITTRRWRQHKHWLCTSIWICLRGSTICFGVPWMKFIQTYFLASTLCNTKNAN